MFPSIFVIGASLSTHPTSWLVCVVASSKQFNTYFCGERARSAPNSLQERTSGRSLGPAAGPPRNSQRATGNRPARGGRSPLSKSPVGGRKGGTNPLFGLRRGVPSANRAHMRCDTMLDSQLFSFIRLATEGQEPNCRDHSEVNGYVKVTHVRWIWRLAC